MARTLSARPQPKRARVVPAHYFKAECGTLERAVLQMKAATDAELAPQRPGGAENAQTDAFGWLSYYRHLHRLHATAVASKGARSPTVAATSELENEIVMGALRQDPVVVSLVNPGGHGTSQLVVHVLSEEALRHLDARDDLLRCLARHARALAESDKPEDHLVRLRVVSEISYQQVVCVWICTSESWPRLPFDPLTDPRPTPPEGLRSLLAHDIVRVQAAHHRLNGIALAVTRNMVSLPDGDGVDTGAGWRTFFSMLEKETSHAIPAAQFMRDRPLVSLLASRIIATDAEREAYDNARAKAEDEARQQGRR